MPKEKLIHKYSYQRKLASAVVQNELAQLCPEVQNHNIEHAVVDPLLLVEPVLEVEFPEFPYGEEIVEAEHILIEEAGQENLIGNDDNDSDIDASGESDASAAQTGDSDSDDSDNPVPEEPLEDINEDSQFQSGIAVWSVQHGITSSATNALLSLLRRRLPFLPKDSRTLKKTPTFTNVKQLVNGQYVHMGVQNSILLKMEAGLVLGCENIELEVFIDGVALYKSVNNECWPILFRSTSFVDQSPGVFGLFYGKGKPNTIDDFLEDYIDEIRHLKDEGILFHGRIYPVSVRFYLADAPARAYLKSVAGHSSAHGCERCDQEGDYIGFQTFQAEIGTLRTDLSFNDRRDEEHHHVHISPLTDLQTGFITQFPLDPMHLIDLGIFKRFLKFVLRRGPVNVRMTGYNIEILGQTLELLSEHIPVEFTRKPTLTRLSKWKAAEYGLVFKYLGLVIFSLVLKDEVYKLFLLLHSTVFIYSNDNLIALYFDCAKQYASQFVQYSAQLFGQQFIVYNQHSFLHLGDDVARYGKLSNFSAYPFESMLGGIKKLILSPAKPLQQIHRRLKEKAFAEARAKRRRADQRLSLEHTNGPVGGILNVITQYSKFENGLCTFYCTVPNNCVQFSDEKYGLVQNFLICEDGMKRVVARTFNTIQDFYDYPMPSSDLGIVTVTDLDEGLSNYLLSDILFKCFLIPLNEDAFVAVPLNHMI